MKFSDLDKDLLVEAEAFDKTQGKMNRAATKLKSKLGPTSGMRQKASSKKELQQQALDIKKQFYAFIGELDMDPTVGAFKAFVDQDNTFSQLSDYVETTAKKLKFPVDKAKEPEDIQKQVPTDDVNYSVELDQKGAPKKEKPKPEEYSDEEKAAIKKKYADDAEAEAKELGSEEADESVEEDAEDAEPEVDMSASIYESRLHYFLILNEKLKDNQIDTLIVRTLQAAKADGAGIKASSGEKTKTSSGEKAAPEEKGESKYRKFMNKASKVAFGDLERSNPGSTVGDDEEYSSSSASLSDNEIQQVKNRLDKFGDDVKGIVRKQSIDDKVKRKMSNEIDDLVADILNNSF